MFDNIELPSYDELVYALKESPYYKSDEKCMQIATKCYPLCEDSQNTLFSTIHISLINNSMYLDALNLEEINIIALKKWNDIIALVLINSYRVSDDYDV